MPIRPDIESLDAFEHLVQVYPELEALLNSIGPIKMPEPPQRSVEDAVVKITIGQFLSRHAASAISSRVLSAKVEACLVNCMKLTDEVLREAGVGDKKVKTIRSFGEYQERFPAAVSAWPRLTYAQLLKSIKGNIWGFSDSSISMLAILDFGISDVFPERDGTIKKVSGLLEERYHQGVKFKPNITSLFPRT